MPQKHIFQEQFENGGEGNFLKYNLLICNILSGCYCDTSLFASNGDIFVPGLENYSASSYAFMVLFCFSYSI